MIGTKACEDKHNKHNHHKGKKKKESLSFRRFFVIYYKFVFHVHLVIVHLSISVFNVR